MDFAWEGRNHLDSSRDMQTGKARERRGDSFLDFVVVFINFLFTNLAEDISSGNHCVWSNFLTKIVVFWSLSLLKFLDQFFADGLIFKILFCTFSTERLLG